MSDIDDKIQAVLKKTLPLIAGEIFRRFIFDQNVTNKDIINDFQDNFVKLLTENIEKELDVKLNEKNVKHIEEKTPQILKGILKGIKVSMNSTYKKHNIPKKTSIDEASVLLDSRKINFSNEVVGQTKFMKDLEDNKFNTLLEKIMDVINLILSSLHLTTRNPSKVLRTTVKENTNIER